MRKDIIEELKQLLEQDNIDIKEQVERLKTKFYSTEPSEEEVEEQAQEEEAFKELLAQYKARRAEVAAEQAKELADNLARKQAILDQMKEIVEAQKSKEESNEGAESVMASLPKMRELQAEWKTIGPVPAEKTQEVRKAYQQYQEQFYDLVKINIELRDLDFKKNLELKTLLCEAAERLQSNENIVEASRALQQLHDEWAEIGPVARELREDLWNRFKAASTVINKKHQAYFDELHAKEQENLQAKQALVEQLKELNTPIVNGEPLSSKQWDDLSNKVQEIQTAWRKIGFAPKKHNQAIYDQYRAECDRFFHAKTEYFKDLRDVFASNLKHKRSLIGQAQEVISNLKEKIENNEATREYWDEATKQVQAMQAEWKSVGVVARKYSDELWKQFSESCDEFFNAKREAFKEERSKGRIAKAERAARQAANQGIDGLRRMRDRLQQEIKTAENNILFFTAKSKTANKLVDSMQKKIDELKQQLSDIQDKMDAEDE
ncbi:MAG: DUF349 domain-containing protein [Paludibacteraceae bacterium]|nr:DUF349 domain-containing protein [Paludibacteraceae bacterium]